MHWHFLVYKVLLLFHLSPRPCEVALGGVEQGAMPCSRGGGRVSGFLSLPRLELWCELGWLVPSAVILSVTVPPSRAPTRTERVHIWRGLTAVPPSTEELLQIDSLL